MTHGVLLNDYKCEYCNYNTKRKYDLKRHHNSIHNNIKKINEENVIPNKENVTPNKENVTPNEENVTPNQEKVSLNEKNENFNKKISNCILFCKKCKKNYKTKKHLLQHEFKCNGIDDLTCPRCLISFSNRHSKSRHIKRNNCIYQIRSINYTSNSNIPTNNIHQLNLGNIKTQNNIEIKNYIEKQENIETQNNISLYINNYRSERLDYLNYEKMLEIFKKSYDIPSILTKQIHFNKDIPENNNIFYSNEKTSLVKMQGDFMIRTLNNSIRELINEKSELMQKFAKENKKHICLKMDPCKYEEIIDKLLTFMLLQEPSELYKKQMEIIRDLIRNSYKKFDLTI